MRLSRGHYGKYPTTLIHSSSTKIPGVEMSADDDDFVRLFASGNFGYGVVDLDGFAAQRALDVDFSLDRPRIQQPPDLRIIFAGHKGRRHADGFVFAARSAHVEESPPLFRAVEDGGHARRDA